MAIRFLLCDIDGTLLDNTAQHLEAWREAFASLGLQPAGETLRRNIGKGGDLFVPAVAGEAWDREHGDECRDLHGAGYKRRLSTVRGVPFAAAFLQQAQQLDLTVVLATSSNPDEVDANLAVIGCRRQDFMVVDKDDARTSKPAPDVFAVALQRVSAKPGDAIALGDTRWDGEAAGRTGVPFWGVLTGAGTRAELEAGGASHIFPDLVALGEGLRRALSPAG